MRRAASCACRFRGSYGRCFGGRDFAKLRRLNALGCEDVGRRLLRSDRLGRHAREVLAEITEPALVDRMRAAIPAHLDAPGMTSAPDCVQIDFAITRGEDGAPHVRDQEPHASSRLAVDRAVALGVTLVDGPEHYAGGALFRALAAPLGHDEHLEVDPLGRGGLGPRGDKLLDDEHAPARRHRLAAAREDEIGRAHV